MISINLASGSGSNASVNPNGGDPGCPLDEPFCSKPKADRSRFTPAREDVSELGPGGGDACRLLDGEAERTVSAEFPVAGLAFSLPAGRDGAEFKMR